MEVAAGAADLVGARSEAEIPDGSAIGVAVGEPAGAPFGSGGAGSGRAGADGPAGGGDDAAAWAIAMSAEARVNTDVAAGAPS